MSSTTNLGPPQLSTIPFEILILIASELPTLTDQCHLASTCHRLRTTLYGSPSIWSPLILSPHADRITDYIFFDILSKRSRRKADDPAREWGDTIDKLDLSGCWRITSQALERLAALYPRWRYLALSTIPTSPLRILLPGQQRPYLFYEHPLKYATWGITATSFHCLLSGLQSGLTSLSLAGHCLNDSTVKAICSHSSLTHLDISNTAIPNEDLQTLLSTLGRMLISLKILGIALTGMSLLILQQHCSPKLQTLHISPSKFSTLQKINAILPHFIALRDLRVTQIISGNSDRLITALPLTIRHLDLSPKLDLIRTWRQNEERGTRIEHHLELHEESLVYLVGHFGHLRSLRLVNPIQTSLPLWNTLLAALPALEIFEFRRWEDDSLGFLELILDPTQDCFAGLTELKPENLPMLRELVLYGVPLGCRLAETWVKFKYLETLDIWNCVGLKKEEVKNIIRKCGELKYVRLGKCAIEWDDIFEGRFTLGEKEVVFLRRKWSESWKVIGEGVLTEEEFIFR